MKRLDRVLLVAAYVLLGAVVVFLSYDVDKRLTEAQTSLEQTQTVLENEAAVACILGQTNLITANGIVNDFIDTLPEENQQVVKLQWTESVLTVLDLCQDRARAAVDETGNRIVDPETDEIVVDDPDSFVNPIDALTDPRENPTQQDESPEETP